MTQRPFYLTRYALKLTYGDVRFSKFFPGEKPPDAAYKGRPRLTTAARGGQGRGEGGRGGRGYGEEGGGG